MRELLGAFTVAVLLTSLGLAQSTQNPPTSQGAPTQPSAAQAPAPPQTGNLRIAPGSVIPVQLTKTVDAKKVKTGDQVVAKVTQDLKTQTGQLLVPKDTEVVGHVTEAQARSKEEKESQLGIAFDHAVLKAGGNVNMPMSIQAVIGPQNPPDNGGGDSSPQASAPSGGGGGGMPQGGGERSGASAGGAGSNAGAGAGGGSPQNTPSSEAGSGGNSQAATQRPPITANTQGVVGISNLKLENSADTKQGSVLTSEKNNVKLEGGTLMLLRVGQ